MNTTISSGGPEWYRVTKGYRWFTVVAVPPLLALMAWAAIETVRNNTSAEIASPLWATAIMLLLYSGVSFALFSGLVWAFRAYVRIDAECMTVRGAYHETTIQPDLLDGFRIINGQLHVYLRNRSQPIQIAYFEKIWSIEQWIRQRTTNIDEVLLDEEASDISQDASLGYHADEKTGQLAFLNKMVQQANFLIYAAIAISAVNFLFIENLPVAQVSVAVLILTPLLLSVEALAHRGHIRIDYDEGSQYPQIITATLASGVTLLLLALLDRGALLNHDLYQFTAAGTFITGLFWCFIDQKRLSVLRERGWLAMVMTVVAFFLIPAAWVGGGLYHINKFVDVSEPVWYETTVDKKTRTSGKIVTYSIDLAPWSKSMDTSVSVRLSRQEFDLYQPDMAVTVAVRAGALNTPWVADVRPGLRDNP